MHHPTLFPHYPDPAQIDTGARRKPGPMSADSQLAALIVQVAWLTEQLQTQLRSAVPTKLVLTVPELAARWSLSVETIRRMIRRKELRTVRGLRPYEIALGEVYRFESGAVTPTKLSKGGAA